MDGPPSASVARFAKLVRELSDDPKGGGTLREGFGTGSLFVGRKMYALLGDDGALVVKLPPPRVAALIAEGVGAPWHPGTGRPLKEYVAIGLSRQRRWKALAIEARAYMGAHR